MSEKKKLVAPTTAQPTEQKYSVAMLREKSLDALGLELSTFDGAFYGIPDSAMFTIAEAKAHAEKWLHKPLKLN